ncbi:hypothetical protein BC832DRAFT_356458 [Gaertneriomyces semiglobifer]|nr:hypothetical protein BC832DRAFT_356458 [Gaertneriomyces semiglobifer]
MQAPASFVRYTDEFAPSQWSIAHFRAQRPDKSLRALEREIQRVRATSTDAAAVDGAYRIRRELIEEIFRLRPAFSLLERCPTRWPSLGINDLMTSRKRRH